MQLHDYLPWTKEEYANSHELNPQATHERGTNKWHQ